MRLRYIAVFAALMGLMVGCGNKQNADNTGSDIEKARKSGKLVFAVIPKGTTHEFWKSIHAGAEDAAKEVGVEIIWKGPLKENDRENQISVVENMTQDKVDGIVVAPLDDKALVTPIEEAVAAKIPVVIIDSDLKSDKYSSFVATDNYKGGQLAAKRMVELLGGKGKVVMMRYQMGSASTQNREQGFVDEIKKTPGITLIDSKQYGGPTTEDAQKVGENILATYKKADGSLDADGIFTPNESTTFGMLRVLQDAKLAGKVKFVGFDSSEKLVEGLKNGEIHGLVLQNPYKMGYEGVKTLFNVVKGNTVMKKVDTGAVVATKENMKKADVDALLNPKKL